MIFEQVKKIVNDAIKIAEEQDIKLPPHDYVNILQEAIEKLIEERLKEDPDAPTYVYKCHCSKIT